MSLRQFTSEKNNNSPSIYTSTSTQGTTSELTTFAESAPEVVTSLGQTDSLNSMANPYADPELAKILSRKYQIASFEWADTDLAGATLATVDPMELLLAVQNIADKLTQFRWLRANVDIEIRLNATPFHIGALMVSHIPRVVSDFTDPEGLWAAKNYSLTQKSQNHGLVMSASSMNNATLSIDREAPLLLDYIDEALVFKGALGTLDFTVMNPLVLATAGSPNPLTISVFASFRDPHPVGYGYFPFNNPPLVEPHSRDVAFEAADRAAGTILGPEAKKLYAPQIITGAIDSLSSMIESVAPAAQFAMSLGLSKPTNETTVMPAIIDDFRDLNYGHGVSQTTKFSLHPGASLGEASMSFLKKNKIKEFVSKPAYLMTYVVDKTDLINTPLLKLPIHPSLSAFSGTVFSPTPLAYASQAFAYYRGGMKLRFQFITSQFVTARVRVTHWPGPTLPSSIEQYAGDAVSAIVDVRGDTNYDFAVPYISPVPYQPTQGYAHANDASGYGLLPLSEQNSFVTLSLVNPLQQPDFDGNAFIYVNVYVAAAEDFVFGGLVSPSVRTPLVSGPVPGTFVRHSLEVDFKKSFKPLVPAMAAAESGMVLPEQFTGIEEICMRYHPMAKVAPLTSGDILPTLCQTDFRTLAAIDTSDCLSYFGQCYRWNRGSLRYKIITVTTGSTSQDRYATLAAQRDGLGGTQYAGAMILDRDQRGAIECEIPWPLGTFMNTYWNNYANDVAVTTAPYGFDLDSLGSAPTIDYMFRAAGDDFVFGHQLAVPTYAFVVPPATLPKVTPVTPPDPKLDQSLGLSLATQEKITAYLKKKAASSAH